MTNCPSSDYDFYAEDNLRDPHEGNRMLRDLGGVVHLNSLGVYALPRYETTKAALADWQTFSSAKGVMINDVMNDFTKGGLLCSDPPVHDVKREVIMRPLTPSALKVLRAEITEEANSVVEGLVGRESFDAVTELAEHLPLSIVSRQVGLRALQGQDMLNWSKASFDTFGPVEHSRTQKALAVLPQLGEFIMTNSARDQIVPGSWLDMLYEAADEGKIPHEVCGPMSIDYIGPSLDTTISALSSAMWLFAKHPEQWDKLRERPSLIPAAINEIVRLESPIQGWFRYVTKDIELAGTAIPAGSRALMMFGSANRDERKWDAPEAFDITRSVADHVGFGHGEHGCAGANLARMEIMAVLSALARKVRRIELVGEATREYTQTTRAWTNIPIKLLLD